MAYLVPTFEALRERYLRDVRNLRPEAHIDGDSDHFVRATGVASAAEGLYDYQSWIARQILPDTADPESLEAHAALRGLSLRPATASQGRVTLTGAPGAKVLPGLQLKLKDSPDAYVLLTGGTVPSGGKLTLECRAVLPGAYPDLIAAPALLQSPPSGVQGECSLDLSGGTDAETHAELLARLLYYMRNPPGGGSRFDYVRWALEVPGVTAAWCYPHRRGTGRVDVVVVSADGLPSAELLAAVQAHIDYLRPVGCRDFLALSPVRLPVTLRAGLRLAAGHTLADLRAPAEAAVDGYFAGIDPGGEIILARLEALLLGLPGVIDAQVLSPAANVMGAPLEWPRLGELILEKL